MALQEIVSSPGGGASVYAYDLADAAIHLLSSIGENYLIHLNEMRQLPFTD